MRRITDILTTEHALLCILFDEIERLLAGVQTVNEVQLLSRLVEGVLSHHADVERDLAFAALDHALAEKDDLRQLHQDHEEIDACLRHAASAKELSKAVQLLKDGLKASRVHFRQEEQSVFPLFEKVLAPSSLETLGAGVIAGASASARRLSRTRRSVDNEVPPAR